MILIVAFLSALALTNAFPTAGKEVIYNYQARVRAGTNEPLRFASQFDLEGKLHLQRENTNSILVRLTDLTYKLYNGQLDQQSEYQSEALQLPQETADLLRIFRIEYDEDGKLRNLVTESGELQYAKNIKKAIASLLQLDLKNIQLDSKQPQAFITEERGIYGKGLVEYNVIPQGEEIIVQKMLDVKTSRNWFSYFGVNVEPLPTNAPISSPLSIGSQRQYTLTKNGNDVQLKQLKSHGVIYLTPMNGLTQGQYSCVNQTLQLLDVVPVDNKFKINSEDRTDRLQFQLETETESGAIADLTFGRHRATKEQYVRLIQHALNDAVTYLQENKLTMEAPEIRKAQAVNRLMRLMSQLDTTALDQILQSLQERNGDHDKQMLNIYQQMLPLIGTRASIVLIRNLIKNNKISEDLAVDMMNKLPFNLRMPSERLLQEVEDLTELGSGTNDRIRKTGILCFASLVHKVFAHKQWSENHHEHQHIDVHNHLMSHYPGNWNTYHNRQGQQQEEILRQQNSNENQSDRERQLEKYVLKFVNLLKNAQDYQSQFLYMQALYNIQIGNVAKYLEPFVKGEMQNSNHNLRYLAMCTSLAGAIGDEERVYKIYWPIFTNRKLSLDIRTAAYFTLVSTKLTMSKLWNINWFMQSEQCPELYNFYYTHLQSLAGTTNPLDKEQRDMAREMLRFVRKPYKTYISGNYWFDYSDPKFGFGGMMKATMLSTSTQKVLYVDFANQIMNIPLQYYSVYLKIDGLDQSLLQRLSAEQDVRYDIKEVGQLIKIISTLQDNKDLQIEWAILHYNQVVQAGLCDKNNIKQLVDEIQNIENTRLFKNSLQIQYNLLSQVVLPNELGLPTVMQMKAPVITNNLASLTREVVNKITNIKGDLKWQMSILGNQDLSFYNPIADIWQGVQRITNYDQVIPLNFNLAINGQQHSVKLTLNNNQDKQKGAIGIRNFVSTRTFVFGDEINNNLKQSNSKCNVIEEVTRGQQNKRKNMIMDVDDENTGLRLQIGSFDDERQLSRNTIMDLIRSVDQNQNRNDGNKPVMGLLLTLRNLWARMVLASGVGTSGLVIRAIPSSQNPVTHIDLSFRCNQEQTKEENTQLPSTKINTRATYSIKTIGDKVKKTWDVNAIIDMNPGRTNTNAKIQITKIVPDQKDYRICIDGIKKWSNNGVTGHLSIASGRSTDGKCVKDEMLIEINMKGEQLKEQRQKDEGQRQVIAECESGNLFAPQLNDWQLQNLRSIDCIRRQTIIRNYEYDVKTTRIPEAQKLQLQRLLNGLTELYNLHYSQEQIRSPVEENNMKILMKYSPDGSEMNMQFIKPQETFNITGIQVREMLLPGFKADNFFLTQKQDALQRQGLISSCIVTQQGMLNAENEVSQRPLGEQWTEIAKMRTGNATVALSLKKIQEQQNRLALRVESEGQVLEVTQYGDQNQITLNGQPLSTDNSYQQESWISVGTLNDKRRTVILNIPEVGMTVVSNGIIVQIDAPKLGSELMGQCFNVLNTTN